MLFFISRAGTPHRCVDPRCGEPVFDKLAFLQKHFLYVLVEDMNKNPIIGLTTLIDNGFFHEGLSNIEGNKEPVKLLSRRKSYTKSCTPGTK